MKIICGTDFSQHAVEAGRVAAMLAIQQGGSLALVHVFEAPGYEHTSPELVALLLDRARETLAGEAARLRETGAVVEEVLLDGSPPAALAEMAGRGKAQLVIVSSLGQIAPSRWFVGSVAERVAQMAPVPTLVVRGEAAFRRWLQGEQPLRVMVAFDLSGGSEAAVRWAGGLREIGECELTVASVASAPRSSWRLGAAESGASLDDLPAVPEELEQELKRKCEELLGDVPVRTHVAAGAGRTDDQLIRLGQQVHADLLVVGMNRRSGLERFWFGSVSRGVLHHAPVSVACVPGLAQ